MIVRGEWDNIAERLSSVAIAPIIRLALSAVYSRPPDRAVEHQICRVTSRQFIIGEIEVAQHHA